MNFIKGFFKKITTKIKFYDLISSLWNEHDDVNMEVFDTIVKTGNEGLEFPYLTPESIMAKEKLWFINRYHW